MRHWKRLLRSSFIAICCLLLRTFYFAVYIIYHCPLSLCRHTFHTLRQVEEFLQIPCFDYAEYAFIPSGNPGSQDDTSSDSSSADAEGADYTDDGFYDTSIAVNVGDSGGKGMYVCVL